MGKNGLRLGMREDTGRRNNRELSRKARGQLGGVKGRDCGKETSGKERTWLQTALAGAIPVNSDNIIFKVPGNQENNIDSSKLLWKIDRHKNAGMNRE